MKRKNIKLISMIISILFSISFCVMNGCTQKNEVNNPREDQVESSTEVNADISEENQGLSEEVKEEGDEEQMKSTTLLYQGHASVRIVTAEGKVIYIDPCIGEGYDLAADLILETHNHYDHTRDDLIKNRNDGCKVIKWSDGLTKEGYQTFDLGYVTVEAVEAGYNKNHDASMCVGFILTFSDGTKAYFSGDTSTTPSMAGLAEKELDYAFICCDGVYNMNTEEASECAKLIGAKHSIPYHVEPMNDKSGFDVNVAESFDAPGRIIIKPGEELELTK